MHVRLRNANLRSLLHAGVQKSSCCLGGTKAREGALRERPLPEGGANGGLLLLRHNGSKVLRR